MLQNIHACITPVLSCENCTSPWGILFLIPSPKERRAVLQGHCPWPGVTALDSHKEEMRGLGDGSGESTMLVTQARGPAFRALASMEKPDLLVHLCSSNTGVGGRVPGAHWSASLAGLVGCGSSERVYFQPQGRWRGMGETPDVYPWSTNTFPCEQK